MYIILMKIKSVVQLKKMKGWYFHKHGTSFIEQVSVSHLRPLMGGTESSISEPGSPSNNRQSETSRQNLSGEMKCVFRAV